MPNMLQVDGGAIVQLLARRAPVFFSYMSVQIEVLLIIRRELDKKK